MCEKKNIIYSQCIFKHTLYSMQAWAWLYDTPSQLALEKLEHGGLPCTGSMLAAVHLHDVLQRRSCINHRIVVRYSGEVQQDFHRTHGITCIQCRMCMWLLFVRAVPFVSTSPIALATRAASQSTSWIAVGWMASSIQRSRSILHRPARQECCGRAQIPAQI